MFVFASIGGSKNQIMGRGEDEPACLEGRVDNMLALVVLFDCRVGSGRTVGRMFPWQFLAMKQLLHSVVISNNNNSTQSQQAEEEGKILSTINGLFPFILRRAYHHYKLYIKNKIPGVLCSSGFRGGWCWGGRLLPQRFDPLPT